MPQCYLIVNEDREGRLLFFLNQLAKDFSFLGFCWNNSFHRFCWNNQSNTPPKATQVLVLRIPEYLKETLKGHLCICTSILFLIIYLDIYLQPPPPMFLEFRKYLLLVLEKPLIDFGDTGYKFRKYLLSVSGIPVINFRKSLRR